MNKTYREINLQYAVHPSLPIWGDLEGWNRDPLFEQYFWLSPYAYCANNPVIYIDPDGREKINGFDKNKKDNNGNYKDRNLHTVARKAPDDKAIHIYAHGSKGGFTAEVMKQDDKVKKYKVQTAEDFKNFLSAESKTWQNKNEGEHVTIVLHSCNTGKGKDSFAEKMSKDDIFENTTIVAPDDFAWGSSTLFTGKVEVAPKATDNNGAIITDAKGKPIRSDKLGNWNYFKGGKIIDTKQGDYQPKAVIQD